MSTIDFRALFHQRAGSPLLDRCKVWKSFLETFIEEEDCCRTQDVVEGAVSHPYLYFLSLLSAFNLIHDLEPEETLKRIEAYKAKEKPAPNSFLPSNSSKDAISESNLNPSQAYLSEDLENNQRKARAMRDLSRNERDSQLKKMEEKEIMKFLENDSNNRGGEVDNDVEKIKRKYQEQREKNEMEDEKEDEMLNRMEKERLREKALKNSSNKKSKRKFNGNEDRDRDRIGIDGKVNGREWSFEMLLDFKGPLSTLDDCDYLWEKDLKDPSTSLYGGGSKDEKKRIEEELWLNRLCWDQQYSQRARAGGFDYVDWWGKCAREGCGTLGIGIKKDGDSRDEGNDVEMKE